ncbi:KAP family P-loop NTPase fold protein [Bacterioplanoides sp.]|uniref:KAP family P-loop NTPase fold protein n=1 Tax=Bacterioplanoides sp. TaxID=2066072 RepID=UPI003AFF745C
MDFDWKWQEPLDLLPPDQLGRGEYAKFLTEFLNSKSTQSYVMNLNAEWGAGKTYFLKRWFNEVKKQHPAAYIDAWKNDFSDDPLLTVITEITEALKNNSNVAADKYKENLFRSGGRLLKQAGPAFFKGILKTYAGVDSDEFDMDSFKDAAEKALSLGVEEHKNKLKELESFKTSIQRWLQDCFKHGQQSPMYVFIDELDRCRPTYAIELLETVKHLFDIEGVVFVIATDTEQLQHSIKAVYGEGFDSSRYLCRFFDRNFSLRRSNVYRFIETRNVTKKLWEILEISCNGQVIFESRRKFIESLSALAESFRFSLRDIEQWLDQLLACFSNTVNKDKYFWVAIAVLLGYRFSNSENLNSLEEVNLSRLANSQYTINFTLTPKYLNQQIVKNSYYDSGIHKEIEFTENFDGYKVRAITLKPEDQLVSSITSAFERSRQNVAQIVFNLEKQGQGEEIPAIAVIIQYGISQYSVSLDNYIDLVEMASDLT